MGLVGGILGASLGHHRGGGFLQSDVDPGARSHGPGRGTAVGCANGPGFGRLPGDAGREDGAGRSAPIQHLAAPFVVAGSCFVGDDRLILLQ